MKKTISILLAVFLLLSAGCSVQTAESGEARRSFIRITQEEAKQMMAVDDGHIVLDVRRQDEYDAGHIPGAVLLPNEDISTEPPEILPDPNQTILIYCRTGNRSKQAAQKLSDMGYANVYEFGGINDWTGEIVTEDAAERMIWSADEQPVGMRYDRMWSYGETAETSDPEMIGSVLAAIKALRVGEKTDMRVDDYTDILTFTFQSGDVLRLEFEEQNWMPGNGTIYRVEGLDRLRSLLDGMLNEPSAANLPVPVLILEINGHVFRATPEHNSSADALIERLTEEPLELDLHDYGHFEKVGTLPWDLPRNDTPITTSPGDIILYQGSQITVYYDVNTWDFTRLAKIDGVSKEDLLSVMGEGNVTVRFRLEWSD